MGKEHHRGGEGSCEDWIRGACAHAFGICGNSRRQAAHIFFLGNNQGGKNHEATDTLDALTVAMIEEFDPKPPPAGEGRSRE